MFLKIFDDDSDDNANADDKDKGNRWENIHDHPESRLKSSNICHNRSLKLHMVSTQRYLMHSAVPDALFNLIIISGYLYLG